MQSAQGRCEWQKTWIIFYILKPEFILDPDLARKLLG